MLLSMVRSKETVGDNLKADIGWKRAHLGFIMEKTQICVAITRCKFGLVIVGTCAQSIHPKKKIMCVPGV